MYFRTYLFFGNGTPTTNHLGHYRLRDKRKTLYVGIPTSSLLQYCQSDSFFNSFTSPSSNPFFKGFEKFFNGVIHASVYWLILCYIMQRYQSLFREGTFPPFYLSFSFLFSPLSSLLFQYVKVRLPHRSVANILRGAISVK